MQLQVLERDRCQLVLLEEREELEAFDRVGDLLRGDSAVGRGQLDAGVVLLYLSGVVGLAVGGTDGGGHG